MLWTLALAIALIAGAMSIMLFYTGLKIEHMDERSSSSAGRIRDSTLHARGHKPHVARNILIWAVLFLGAAFGNLEWSFYLLGYNMFTFFAFPLVAFFGIWFGWIIWLFEKRKERIVWVVFLIALAILTIVAFNCMNCLAIP